MVSSPKPPFILLFPNVMLILSLPFPALIISLYFVPKITSSLSVPEILIPFEIRFSSVNDEPPFIIVFVL